MKLWQFLLMLMGLVFLGGTLLLGFNFVLMPRLIHRNEVVLMPDLRGMTVADAEAAAQALHLQVHATRVRPHPTIAAGMILEQLPAPSVPIRRGRMVRVITSSGPPAGAVPNLAGLTVHQAEITLQREAYRLGRILHIRRDEVSEPTVVYQSPGAGVDLPKGRTINLVLAEPGPQPQLRMPDLRGAPLYRARQAIAAAGCVLAPVIYERSSDLPAQVVLSQSPPSGRRIEKGTRIELVASSR